MDLQGSNPSTVWFGGTRVLVSVTAAQSDGRLGAWESEESLGVALPLHTHAREHEQVMLLEGEVTFRVGDRVHHLGPPLALDRASITE